MRACDVEVEFGRLFVFLQRSGVGMVHDSSSVLLKCVSSARSGPCCIVFPFYNACVLVLCSVTVIYLKLHSFSCPLHSVYSWYLKNQSSPSSSAPPPPAPWGPGSGGKEEELKEDALASNPVCRFTSSLIRSNRSQLSHVLGQGAGFEPDANLAGSKGRVPRQTPLIML